jgi:Tol biopolymer transport system component
VGLAAWVTLGVLLVTRANNLGLVDDISFSPYHVVGYAALGALGLYVAWTFFRALPRGRWRSAFPPLYGGLGLGFLLIVAWVVLDPIWRTTLGIRDDSIENGLAPTRLLIPIGIALLASGPLREALALRAERGLRPDELRIRWAGVVATGILGSALTLPAFNPIQNPVSDYAYRPSVDASEIWVMSADGSAQTRLLQALGDGTDYSLPAWSPDGQRIAYTTWVNDGGAPQNAEFDEQSASIWTMAADGTDRRLIVDGGDDQLWIPSWSPDGEWLAYTLTPLSDGTAMEPQQQPQPGGAPGQAGPPASVVGASIWAVRPDGTDARRLTGEGEDGFGASWAPHGSQIAYVVTLGPQLGLYVATVTDTGLIDKRLLVREDRDLWGASWSPDGAWVGFTSNRSGNDEIYIVDSGGVAPPTQLTKDSAGDWVPAWYPDGSRIAFVSDRTGEPEIWSMAADGSDLRNLTNHPQHFDGTWSLSWSPDGSRLAYGNSAFQDPVASGWVREDLASAEMLLFALALAVLGLVLAALGAPAGGFGAVLTIVALAGAIPVDGWRFVPGALVAGLIVDGIVRAARPRWRSRVAAAALPALGTLGLGLTIGLGGTLAWSITLLLGVSFAAAAVGWGLGEAVERLLPARGREPLPPEGAA